MKNYVLLNNLTDIKTYLFKNSYDISTLDLFVDMNARV